MGLIYHKMMMMMMIYKSLGRLEPEKKEFFLFCFQFQWKKNHQNESMCVCVCVYWWMLMMVLLLFLLSILFFLNGKKFSENPGSMSGFVLGFRFVVVLAVYYTKIIRLVYCWRFFCCCCYCQLWFEIRK